MKRDGFAVLTYVAKQPNQLRQFTADNVSLNLSYYPTPIHDHHQPKYQQTQPIASSITQPPNKLSSPPTDKVREATSDTGK